jgi:malate dehydrogenase
MPTVIDKDGVHFTVPEGTADEMAALQARYEHWQKMRDEIIGLGIIPPVEKWGEDNPNLV